MINYDLFPNVAERVAVPSDNVYYYQCKFFNTFPQQPFAVSSLEYPIPFNRGYSHACSSCYTLLSFCTISRFPIMSLLNAIMCYYGTYHHIVNRVYWLRWEYTQPITNILFNTDVLQLRSSDIFPTHFTHFTVSNYSQNKLFTV